MDYCFKPGCFSGTVAAPPSKSEAHRALFGLALTESGGTAQSSAPTDWSDDIRATCCLLNDLGAEIQESPNGFLVRPLPRIPHGECGITPASDLSESGTTLRLAVPVLAAWLPPNKSWRLTGHGRLPSRPLAELVQALRQNGAAIEPDHLPLAITGSLRPGLYELPGNVSSQYISGLMFALPWLVGDSEIRLTTPLESSGYVAMTCDTLSRLGVKIHPCPQGWLVPGNQWRNTSGPRQLRIGGDWSNAALWLCAGALGKPVAVSNLDTDTKQGDHAIVSILEQFGAQAKTTADGLVFVRHALHGITVDLRDIPDLLPVLAVVAAGAHGETRFVHAGRLRLKESDRLSSIASLLTALGGNIREENDSLVVTGTGRLHGGRCQVANDHRLVMAAALASVIADSPVEIDNLETVHKSYPGFVTDYLKLKE